MSNKRTIFNTPVLTDILRLIAIISLKLSGWKLDFGNKQEQPSSFVLIGAPHTSNWDFVLMLIVVLKLRLKIKWMGKHSLFKAPFKPIMLWMGGIPVDRRKAHNLVAAVIDEYKTNSELIVLIPPEGTRSQVNEWKTGFYHIARMAEVPVLMAAIDGKTKNIKLLGQFHPQKNDEEGINEDIAKIRGYYHNIEGIKPRGP